MAPSSGAICDGLLKNLIGVKPGLEPGCPMVVEVGGRIGREGEAEAGGARLKLVIRLGSGLIRIKIRFVHTTAFAFLLISFAGKEDTWDKIPSHLEIKAGRQITHRNGKSERLQHKTSMFGF